MLSTYRSKEELPKDRYCPDANGGRMRMLWKPMSKTCPACAYWTPVTGKPANSHEVIGLGYVCARQAQFQGQLEISNAMKTDQKAIEEERNMLIQAFNQQAGAQAHLTQQVAKMVTATDDMKLSIVSRMDGYTALPMPVVDEPQKLLG